MCSLQYYMIFNLLLSCWGYFLYFQVFLSLLQYSEGGRHVTNVLKQTTEDI